MDNVFSPISEVSNREVSHVFHDNTLPSKDKVEEASMKYFFHRTKGQTDVDKLLMTIKAAPKEVNTRIYYCNYSISLFLGGGD